MNYATIIPAIPGTTIVWHNHCHDSTQEEPVLFWGVKYEDGGGPFVVPLTFDAEGGQASPFELPENEHREGESSIIAFNIPGWPRLSAADTGPVYGSYMRQTKGYVKDF